MNITIRGLDELTQKLGRIATMDVLEKPMQQALYTIQRDMAQYPPQRSGTSYVRTGTLGRKWTAPAVTRESGGLVGKVGNNTEYGPWVQSKAFQARVHQGHWQTDERVLQDNEQHIVGLFQDAVDRGLAGRK